MVAKVAGGILGIGLIGAGGIAVTKPHWLGMDYMPSFHALSKDDDYSTKKSNEYGANKFGNKISNYLVGVKGNESWWEWSFRRLKADNPPATGKFKYEGKEASDAVTRPYSDNDAKALNQICKAAYEKQSGEVDANGGDDKFRKSEVWKYCSPLGQEPEKVGTNEYSEKIGSESEANFISVKDGVNDMFWVIRDKEIKGNDPNFEKIAPSASETYFTNKDKTLKKLCEEAYGTQKAGAASGSPTVDTTKKYCVFEISTSS